MGLTFSEQLVPVLQMSRQMSVDAGDGDESGAARRRRLPHSKSVQELCHKSDDGRAGNNINNRQLRPTRQLTHV